ncbi:MAG: urease accessory protein UreF [Desulfomonilaceae bacterium]
MNHQEYKCPNINLFQVVDSSFPSGGFAFSYGLESMVKLGFVKNVEDFRKYISNFLTQISFSEIPFVNGGYKGAPEFQLSLAPVMKMLDAFITIPCLHKASLMQGKVLLRVMRMVYPQYGLDSVLNWLQDNDLSSHYGPLFGNVCRTIGFTHLETLFAYTYISLRDQIGAGIKLGIFGPHEAQGILGEILGKVSAKINLAKDLEWHKAYRVAFALEIAQANHPGLYSRLFQN